MSIFFDQASVELKDPLARWVVNSADDDELEADKDFGGTGTAFGSHPALNVEEEGSLSATCCSGSVSLTREGDGTFCLTFLEVLDELVGFRL